MQFSRHIPNEVTAGTTFCVNAPIPSRDGSPVVSATLLLRGPSSISLDGVANGTVWTFEAAAAATEQWTPGTYWYVLRVVTASETRDVANGQIEFLPDFASLPTGYDGRSDNEKALEAIDAVIANRASMDQQRYTIGDRELWRTPMNDLLLLQASYRVKVRRERARAKGINKFGRKIIVDFN